MKQRYGKIFFIFIILCIFAFPNIVTTNAEDLLRKAPYIYMLENGVEYHSKFTAETEKDYRLHFQGSDGGGGLNYFIKQAESSNTNVLEIIGTDEGKELYIMFRTKESGSARITVYTEDQFDRAGNTLSIEIAVGDNPGPVEPEEPVEPEDPGEEEPGELPPEIIELIEKYNKIPFENYENIYNNRIYTKMLIGELKALSEKLKEHFKIATEYLEKYDIIVPSPIRPEDFAEEEKFIEYRNKEREKEAGRTEVYNNKLLLKHLLVKVNDKINFIRYGVEETNDIDKTLWEKAQEFLNPQGVSISGSKVAVAVVSIGSALITIAAVLFPLITIVMGIKYMLADSEQKGKLKTQMVGLFISTGVTFGAFIIWRASYAIMASIIK